MSEIISVDDTTEVCRTVHALEEMQITRKRNGILSKNYTKCTTVMYRY